MSPDSLTVRLTYRIWVKVKGRDYRTDCRLRVQVRGWRCKVVLMCGCANAYIHVYVHVRIYVVCVFVRVQMLLWPDMTKWQVKFWLDKEINQMKCWSLVGKIYESNKILFLSYLQSSVYITYSHVKPPLNVVPTAELLDLSTKFHWNLLRQFWNTMLPNRQTVLNCSTHNQVLKPGWGGQISAQTVVISRQCR